MSRPRLRSRSGAYEAVLDVVRRISPCVIVDLPHMWTPWVRQTLLSSDDIVIVAYARSRLACATARRSSILVKQNRPNDAPPRLVLNQVGQPKRPEIPVKDFAETIGIEPSCSCLFDPQLYGAAANNGQMLMEVKPKSPTADGIKLMAELITGRTPARSAKERSAVLSMFNKVRKQA